MKVRIRFAKDGIMKFIGHLDMVRYFQKAFRRAGLDMQYSQGFSPHQLISFASPLGIGLTSEGEYMDVFMNGEITSEEMIRRVNEQMVEGVRILSCKRIIDETKHSNAMAIVAGADYQISFRQMPVCSAGELESAVNAFFDQDEILMMKKTKKSEREVDIRPHIFEMKYQGQSLFVRLSAGSETNIKPELVMEALYKHQGWAFDAYNLLIHRVDLLAKGEGDEMLISLDELGVKM